MCDCRVTPAFPGRYFRGLPPSAATGHWGCLAGRVPAPTPAVGGGEVGPGPSCGARPRGASSRVPWLHAFSVRVRNVQGKYMEEISRVNIQSYPHQLRYQCFQRPTAGPRTIRLQKRLPIPTAATRWKVGNVLGNSRYAPPAQRRPCRQGPPGAAYVSDSEVLGGEVDGRWVGRSGRGVPRYAGVTPLVRGMAPFLAGRPPEKPPATMARLEIENDKVPPRSPESQQRCMGTRRFV